MSKTQSAQNLKESSSRVSMLQNSAYINVAEHGLSKDGRLFAATTLPKFLLQRIAVLSSLEESESEVISRVASGTRKLNTMCGTSAAVVVYTCTHRRSLETAEILSDSFTNNIGSGVTATAAVGSSAATVTHKVRSSLNPQERGGTAYNSLSGEALIQKLLQQDEI